MGEGVEVKHSHVLGDEIWADRIQVEFDEGTRQHFMYPPLCLFGPCCAFSLLASLFLFVQCHRNS